MSRKDNTANNTANENAATKPKKKLPVWAKVILSVLGAILLIVLGYVAYVFGTYSRIDDYQKLEIKYPEWQLLDCTLDDFSEKEIKGMNGINQGEVYKAMTFNIGFGAYIPEFGFFMDGGKESKGFSKEAVEKDINEIIGFVAEKDVDFLLIEEIDTNSTRSYHINQAEMCRKAFPEFSSVYAINYDSAFLMYPVFDPHGKSLSGVMTMSEFTPTDSLRRSLPIEDSVMKIVDLDRCYTVTRYPVNATNTSNDSQDAVATNSNKELVVYTVHLSAYTSDGKIADEQAKMLIADMQSEYEAGNYVICGGDFNKDMVGNSEDIFGYDPADYNWAQDFPFGILDGTALQIVGYDNDGDKVVPSCRNADGPLTDEQMKIIVDGFIVSDNVEVISNKVIDTGFAYSDHNPVMMEFVLK